MTANETAARGYASWPKYALPVGFGVIWAIDAVFKWVGNSRLLDAAGVTAAELAGRADELSAEGKTAILVAVDGAPAGLVAVADVGLAIGTGTDVAIEAADVPLMSGSLARVPAAIGMSRATMRNIRQNLTLAFAYNIAGIPIAAGPALPVLRRHALTDDRCRGHVLVLTIGGHQRHPAPPRPARTLTRGHHGRFVIGGTMTTPTADTRAPSRGKRPPPPARLVVRAVYRPWARWAATSALTGRSRSLTDPALGRFTSRDVRHLLDSAWADFDRLSADLPGEPTIGSRQNVMLAALTLAMLDALIKDGVSRDYAIELIGDTCWKIYAQWGRVPRALARLVTRDPARRMRVCVGVFLRFPFNQPGYRYQDRPEPAGRALDMLRCPVADYLGAHVASDLAVGTWCNLDFQLARMWGGTLERHATLADGAGKCDFRFRAATAESVPLRAATEDDGQERP